MGYTDADTCAVDIAADSLGVVVDLDPWQLSGTSVYVGNHGYTGHEFLPGFGLINCNARLYDPALGRFLMPDPLIQDPASTQNFNRYSYCLNNPLKYTDESGEYALVDDAFAGLIGGILNWVSNGHAFTRQGLTYFVVGFGGGVASLYVSPVAGAAAVSAANSVVKQGFDESGNQWNGKNINPFTVAYDGIIGAVTSWLGGALTSQVSSWIGNFTDLIPGKAVAQMLNRSLSSGVVALGTNAISAYGVSREGDLEYWEAFSAGMDNVWQAMAIGALTGTAEGIRQARELGENPWSSRIEIDGTDIEVSAQDLGVQQTVDRIMRGQPDPYKNDGIIHENRYNILPKEQYGYYREYVHRIPGSNMYRPGTHRVIVGGNYEVFYYSPDHYKTYIKFKL